MVPQLDAEGHGNRRLLGGRGLAPEGGEGTGERGLAGDEGETAAAVGDAGGEILPDRAADDAVVVDRLGQLVDELHEALGGRRLMRGTVAAAARVGVGGDGGVAGRNRRAAGGHDAEAGGPSDVVSSPWGNYASLGKDSHVRWQHRVGLDDLFLEGFYGIPEHHLLQPEVRRRAWKIGVGGMGIGVAIAHRDGGGSADGAHAAIEQGRDIGGYPPSVPIARLGGGREVIGLEGKGFEGVHSIGGRYCMDGKGLEEGVVAEFRGGGHQAFVRSNAPRTRRGIALGLARNRRFLRVGIQGNPSPASRS